MEHSTVNPILGTIAVLVLLTPPVARSTPTTAFVLDFGSLPSAQGFVYQAVGNGLAESAIFSVDGTTLFQNSLAAGFQGQGRNSYIMFSALDPAAVAFTLEVRAKVIVEDSNPASAGGHNHFGLGFAFPGTHSFGVGAHALTLEPFDPTPEGSHIRDSVLLDGAQFHDYRLEADLGNQTNKIFVDGVLRAEGPVGTGSIDLVFGDLTGGANAHAEITRFVFTLIFPVRTIAIDIKPGSSPNCFNINGHGVIPVAILGAVDFDVNDVDVSTLRFGGLEVRVRGNRGPLCSTEFSNTDSFLDMVCHFEDDPSMWLGGDAEATLTGALLEGTEIEGTDSICIVP